MHSLGKWLTSKTDDDDIDESDDNEVAVPASFTRQIERNPPRVSCSGFLWPGDSRNRRPGLLHTLPQIHIYLRLNVPTFEVLFSEPQNLLTVYKILLSNNMTWNVLSEHTNCWLFSCSSCFKQRAFAIEQPEMARNYVDKDLMQIIIDP